MKHVLCVELCLEVPRPLTKREEVPVCFRCRYATSFLWRSEWRKKAGRDDLDIYFCRAWSCHSMNNLISSTQGNEHGSDSLMAKQGF